MGFMTGPNIKSITQPELNIIIYKVLIFLTRSIGYSFFPSEMDGHHHGWIPSFLMI